MTAFATVLNALLGVAFVLLVARLLVSRWTSGGAIIALAIVFVYLLIAYDPILAMIGGFLMLIAMPTLGRSQLGVALGQALRAVTDPVVDGIRRASGGRAGEVLAILIAIAAIWLVRFVVLLPILRG